MANSEVRTRIESWNPGKGFGFCQVNGRRVFVHYSAVSPRPARGSDLTGQEIMVDGVDRTARKGPRALRVELVGEWKLDEETGEAYLVVEIGEEQIIAEGFRYQDLDLGYEIPEDLPPAILAALKARLREEQAEWAKEAALIAGARHPMDWTCFYAQSDYRGGEYDEDFPGCADCETTEFGEYAEGADGTVLCRSCWEARLHELCNGIRSWEVFSFPTPSVANDLADDDRVSHLIGRDDLKVDRERALDYLGGWRRPDGDGRPPDWQDFGRRWAGAAGKSNRYRTITR